jgi:drug/metabolite transporter (DMT)-like permease
MTVADVAAGRRNQVPLGIAYMVGSTAMFAGGNAVVGFVGVLIITHPGTGALTYGALFALGNAVLISTVAIAIRRMSVTESTETLTLYQMSIMTLCTAGLLTLGFRAPQLRDALMLALAGVGNGIAQLWWTRSLSLAPPSAVVPFNYLSLVWAMILGFAVWGDVPTPAC